MLCAIITVPSRAASVIAFFELIPLVDLVVALLLLSTRSEEVDEVVLVAVLAVLLSAFFLLLLDGVCPMCAH